MRSLANESYRATGYGRRHPGGTASSPTPGVPSLTVERAQFFAKEGGGLLSPSKHLQLCNLCQAPARPKALRRSTAEDQAACWRPLARESRSFAADSGEGGDGGLCTADIRPDVAAPNNLAQRTA